MIAFLPVWILGVPLVLALVDLMATRSGARDVEYDTVPTARHTGLRGELRRGEESSAVTGQGYRENSPANVS
ncbi:MAG: hypothetical protein MUF07_11320 [Steroidobacteraceae bacterium]|nr:hypothetical protein [Steroidobacteraceae bacterium]